MHRIALLFVLVACKGGSGATSTGPKAEGNSRESGLVAFETVRGVLQHPRCQNCHPAGDAPLQGDEGRVHHQNVLRGPTGNGVAGAECTSCHREANPPDTYGAHQPPGVSKGWHMPPPEMKMVFVGVTPTALCEQVKDPARNGGMNETALRTHLDDPLVTWAWTPGFGRKPPPVSHAEFVKAWETWFAAGAPCP